MSISVVVWDFVGIISLSVSIVGIGIMDRFLGDDDENPSGMSDATETSGDSLGDAFEEAVSGDPSDPLESAADDFGGLTGGDDDWGGFEDEELGELEMGDGVDTANLKTRVDELENDIESVSSTISTVRSENEEISRHVADIQDNVRKLLDIYEMVTRGVNPFIEDVEGSPDGSGTFGLFEEPTGSEASDDSGEGQEVEDFFADDFDDAQDQDSADPVVEIKAESEDESQDDDGMTFEELKAEYTNDNDTWNDDDGIFSGAEAADSDGPDPAPEPEEPDARGGGDEEPLAVDPDPEAVRADSVEGTTEGEESFAVEPDADTEDGDVVESDDEDWESLAVNPDPGTEDGEPEDEATRTPDDGVDGSVEKPYLTLLPDEYGADVLVMEWLAYLVDESSVGETLQAIRYYRNIEWISDTVADELRTILGGVRSGDPSVSPDGSGLSELSIEHHQASLAFINHLTDKELRHRSFRMGGRNLGL